MELVVGSKYLVAAIGTALDTSGREHLIVVAKATWRLPAPGERPRPLSPQPLCYSDQYYGEPGESAMRYGSDFARFKARCDVLLDGCAHAPGGRPVVGLRAGLRVGALRKEIRVLGPRVWNKTLAGYKLSDPEPFAAMPLHYGLAFGGTLGFDKHGEGRVDALPANPAGIGWAGRNTLRQLDGQPAPSLEAFDDPVTRPDGTHAPVAFGAVARHWQPRMTYAGTYDAHWRENVFPFLPEDFDERFHQCAPADQQIDHPQGGEEVGLLNLVKGRGELHFRLPALDHVKVRILRKDYSIDEPAARVDTLYFETEQGRFSAVWRASTPIRRRIQEFDTIAVGPVDAAWWRDKALGIDGDCLGCAEQAA